jgi:hypothetical protein
MAASQLIEQDSTFAGDYAAADRRWLTGALTQTLLQLIEHVRGRALFGESVAYGAYGKLDDADFPAPGPCSLPDRPLAKGPGSA